MKSQNILFLATTVILFTQYSILFSQTVKGKDYALFFAVDDYTQSNLKNLNNPVKDAYDIARELWEMYSFETTIVENPNKEQIENILINWQQKEFGEHDQLFVFFSGHGDKIVTSAKGYFVSAGNKTTRDKAYMDFTDIRNMVALIPCDHIILALDACFSGLVDPNILPIFNKSPIGKRPGETLKSHQKRTIRNQLRNKSRIIIASGEEETKDGINNSPFSAAIIKSLQLAYSQGDGLLVFKELEGVLSKIDPLPKSINFKEYTGGFVFLQNPNPLPFPERALALPPPPPPPPPPLPLPEEDEIFMDVEDMPLFPGCEGEPDKAAKKKCSDRAVLKFVEENLEYPKIARENGVEGMVVVQFVVKKDGKIANTKILRDIGVGCGDEAIRVINSINSQGITWTPGKHRGRSVNVALRIPIRYKLEGSSSNSEKFISETKVRGNLMGRGIISRPKLFSETESGEVVIKVCVTASGTVSSAKVQMSGTTASINAQQKTLENAKKWIFLKSELGTQCGWITYNFSTN